MIRIKDKREKGPANWTIMILAAAFLTVVLTGPASAESPQPSLNAPAMGGSTLLEMRCSVCHSAEKAKKKTKTLEEWDRTVTRMINKGAKLTEAEKSVLVDYLANTYPKAE